MAMGHLGPETVRSKFRGMVKRCADSGFDLAAGMVEVVPTAHYFMGGVIVDPDTRTELLGLYVAGEDAGGAHGSNRLGGNGVANSTVYGGVAGDVMGRDALTTGVLRDPDEALLTSEIDRALYPLSKPTGNLPELRSRLMETMWQDVGVMRTRTGIERGIAAVEAIGNELMHCGVSGENLEFNLTWHDWLNMRSLLDVSLVIAKAALSRENSRGAHFREDFPDSGSLENSLFTVARLQQGELAVTQEAVRFTVVRPGESLLDNDEIG